MTFSKMIYKIRKEMNMTQEQFASEFKVSKQAMQKWENGTALPEINKIIEIAKRFDISLDTLLLNRDKRAMDDMKQHEQIVPNYAGVHDWEMYVSSVMDEYTQCVDEGMDIAIYKDIFTDISKLPKDDIKKKFGDVIYDIVGRASIREDYPYTEPSTLSEIRTLRKPYKEGLGNNEYACACKNKLLGAWIGRTCGCMLGKTLEGIRSNELETLLKETDNYPLYRYVLRKDIEHIDITKYSFPLFSRQYVDEIDGMPPDDDMNYTVLAQKIIETYDREFTSLNVAQMWIQSQPKDAYCTAERVAFRNFINGYEPPCSAVYKNPYREWIGAQIRADYYGYINPGNPEMAAAMAFRDASISHVKNGIYGAMFVAAMLAIAAITDNMEDIVLGGLAQIPSTSRLYHEIQFVVDSYKKRLPLKTVLKYVQQKYDEATGYGWCHTISNAMIVVASLLYGNGNYSNSICLAVGSAYDTDCNGATVGSIVGMAKGIERIPVEWIEPIHDTLHTTIFGVDTVSITELVEKTMEHIGA